jgi:hypothetical protein
MAGADAGSPTGASPYATGGGGTVLEHRYGAVLLACLLSGDPVTELGDDATPLSVRFQASSVSPVDDLLVVGRTLDGGERRVSIGVRRAPAFVASEEASAHLLASYARIVTSHWEQVQAGRWRLCLAVASPSTAAMQLRALAEIARASMDEAGFRAEVARPGRTSQATRRRLPHIDALVARAAGQAAIDRGEVGTGELTWRVLAHLQVRELRLEGGDEADRTIAVRGLRAVTGDGALTAADRAFSRLAELASGYAPAGAEVTKVMLSRDLSGMPLRRSLPPRAVAEWEPLQLGVHRAITADRKRGPTLPELTPYRSSTTRQPPAVESTTALEVPSR